MNNLKETYKVVCNLLRNITKQEFSIQDVDDRNNIADFNIICNDDWQVLYPTLQEEFASLKNLAIFVFHDRKKLSCQKSMLI